MQELLEPVVNSPQVQYVLENPMVAAAGATASSVAVGAAVGFAGQVKGEREIDHLDQQFENDEAYEDAVLERKEELAEEVERESFWRETYNHIRHAYTSGKLGAFEEEETKIKGSTLNTPDEYYNQKFSDKDLEYLD